MKIYLAARYTRHADMRYFADQLRKMGHEVTSRWIDGSHEVSREEPEEVANAKRTRFAQEDVEDLLKADCVISFTENPNIILGKGGRHVEFGMALAEGKQLVIVGPRENVFHYLPNIVRFETVDAAAAWARWKS